VLADARGRTIYLYNCRDDSLAQLACDHPNSPQEYRMAICGNGDPELCRRTFPYVQAKPDDRSDSSLWTVLAIDPDTGRHAAADQDNTIHVWAYRKRPVYTYAGDREPGVTNGDGIGEFTGRRNGYKAFVLRDDFGENAFHR
jgi:predicted lipoprotein with Yx(FWY)xxD motif